jgi:hypothetical protein
MSDIRTAPYLVVVGCESRPEAERVKAALDSDPDHEVRIWVSEQRHDAQVLRDLANEAFERGETRAIAYWLKAKADQLEGIVAEEAVEP